MSVRVSAFPSPMSVHTRAKYPHKSWISPWPRVQKYLFFWHLLSRWSNHTAAPHKLFRCKVELCVSVTLHSFMFQNLQTEKGVIIYSFTDDSMVVGWEGQVSMTSCLCKKICLILKKRF